jgi:hypothetical protein
LRDKKKLNTTEKNRGARELDEREAGFLIFQRGVGFNKTDTIRKNGVGFTKLTLLNSVGFSETDTTFSNSVGFAKTDTIRHILMSVF